MLHGLCCGEEAGVRNLVFFRVKWLQAAMKGTSSVLGAAAACVILLPFAAEDRKSHWSGCMKAAKWIC